jgi:transketolase
LVAAEKLYKEGIDVEVLHCPTIKPLDGDTIVESVNKTNRVITIEEHQVAGGLGSAVAELLSEEHPVKIKRLGVNDQFGESGKPDELLEKHKLTARHIMFEVHRMF